jgi:hypothetical protein
MRYLKLFEKDADYQAFMTGGNVDLPNVSFSIDTAKVYYNPDKKQLIEFYINRPHSNETITCQAEQGMTWMDWYSSDYSTEAIKGYNTSDGFIFGDWYIEDEVAQTYDFFWRGFEGFGMGDGIGLTNNDGSLVNINKEIRPNETYVEEFSRDYSDI